MDVQTLLCEFRASATADYLVGNSNLCSGFAESGTEPEYCRTLNLSSSSSYSISKENDNHNRNLDVIVNDKKDSSNDENNKDNKDLQLLRITAKVRQETGDEACRDEGADNGSGTSH